MRPQIYIMSRQKEMNNRIGPTVKQLWNYAVHVLHNF